VLFVGPSDFLLFRCSDVVNLARTDHFPPAQEFMLMSLFALRKMGHASICTCVLRLSHLNDRFSEFLKAEARILVEFKIWPV
jgi:hypothetical protein